MFTVHVELQMNVNSLANGSLRRKQKNLQGSEGVLRMGAARNPGVDMPNRQILAASERNSNKTFLFGLQTHVHDSREVVESSNFCP